MIKLLQPYAKRVTAVRAEAVWLAGGHLGIGIGGVAGIAILTRVMDAASFGTLSLYVGVTSLVLSTLVNPVIQTGMRFFSAARDEADLRRIRAITLRWLKIVLSVVAVTALLTALVIGPATGITAQALILMAGLLAVDSYRAYETSMLNAARKQREFVLWRTLDSWARPLAAALCVLLFCTAVWPGLLGYMLATLVLTIVFWAAVRPERKALEVVRRRGSHSETPTDMSTMVRYALPVAPIGLMAWVLGSGDRYIIASMLSLEAAGLYAAIYSVTSRPFMALGAFLDVLLRPRLYDAASAGDWERFRQIFMAWMAVCLTISGLLFVLMVLAAEPLTRFLLGETFSKSAELMPWIALGYGVNTAYQPFLRTFHSFLLSSYVLVIQIITTILGVISTLIGIWMYGLLGAAIAIPVYFSLRLVIAGYMLSRSEKTRNAILGRKG